MYVRNLRCESQKPGPPAIFGGSLSKRLHYQYSRFRKYLLLLIAVAKFDRNLFSEWHQFLSYNSFTTRATHDYAFVVMSQTFKAVRWFKDCDSTLTTFIVLFRALTQARGRFIIFSVIVLLDAVTIQQS